jgi:hypothetical protein
LCRLADVPVMVTVDAPSAAELDADKVNVLAPLALIAPKDAVTPEGSPDAARVTVPLKPFCGVMVMVLVVELAGVRFRLLGAAETVNVGDPVMVSASLAVLVKLPEVPVMVIVDVAAAAELLAIRVRVLVVIALAGLKDAVTPAGNPEAVRFAALVKPCCAPTVMMLTPLAPAAIESEGADVDRLNPGEFVVAVKPLMSGWPAGLPHPVARSYPASALNPPLLPVTMSCRSLVKLDPAPMP